MKLKPNVPKNYWLKVVYPHPNWHFSTSLNRPKNHHRLHPCTGEMIDRKSQKLNDHMIFLDNQTFNFKPIGRKLDNLRDAFNGDFITSRRYLLVKIRRVCTGNLVDITCRKSVKRINFFNLKLICFLQKHRHHFLYPFKNVEFSASRNIFFTKKNIFLGVVYGIGNSMVC